MCSRKLFSALSGTARTSLIERAEKSFLEHIYGKEIWRGHGGSGNGGDRVVICTMESWGTCVDVHFRLFELLHGGETGVFGPDLLASGINKCSARDSRVLQRCVRTIRVAALFRRVDVAAGAIAVSSGSSCVALVLCGGNTRLRLVVAGTTMAHSGNM